MVAGTTSIIPANTSLSGAALRRSTSTKSKHSSGDTRMNTSLLKTHWESLPERAIRKLQAEKLHRYLRDVVLPFSPFYRELFRERGISADSIRSLDDLGKIPFTTKAELLNTRSHPQRAKEFLLIPDQRTLSRRPHVVLQALVQGRSRVQRDLESEYPPILLPPAQRNRFRSCSRDMISTTLRSPVAAPSKSAARGANGSCSTCSLTRPTSHSGKRITAAKRLVYSLPAPAAEKSAAPKANCASSASSSPMCSSECRHLFITCCITPQKKTCGVMQHVINKCRHSDEHIGLELADEAQLAFGAADFSAAGAGNEYTKRFAAVMRLPECEVGRVREHVEQLPFAPRAADFEEIGRASCRER